MKKKQHILAILVGILLIGGLAIIPDWNTPEPPANEFVGTWETGGVTEEGQEWWIKYEINNSTYIVTTSSDYREEGTYTIGERYLDGSTEFMKTWNEGQKTHTMIIVPTDDPDIKTIDGMALQRITENE